MRLPAQARSAGRVMSRLLASAAFATLIACTVKPPDGTFACSLDTECPYPQRCYVGVCSAQDPRLAGSAGQATEAASVSQAPAAGAAMAQPQVEASAGDAAVPSAASNAGANGSAAANGTASSRASGGIMAGSAAAPAATRCPANACAPGRCVDGPDDYTCDCGAGFSGSGTKSCVEINECPKPDPCAPGGVCVDKLADFGCECGKGFRGSGMKACSDIDDCLGSPCGQGGVCVDGIDSYRCLCSSGYTNAGVETQPCVNIDDCVAGNACSPGGTCIDGILGYSCKCNGEVPWGVPANSCRFTIKGDGIVDAQTGLSWSQMVYEIYRDTDTPAQGCQRQGEGRRPPTVAELKTVIEFAQFNLMTTADGPRCFATTTTDVCGPGATAAAQTHGLRCVR